MKNHWKTFLTCGVLACGLLAAPALCSAEEPADDEGWVDLFDGETLNGWTPVGGTAEYRVEDDMIIGRTNGDSPNTFLCTDREYADFELEFEVYVDEPLNSGAQIRSHEGQRRRRSTIHGYQVEIDSDGDAGFVYDEGGRHWLTTDRQDPEKRAAMNVGGWNQFRIRFVGDHLQTWVNGIAIADFHDDHDASGIIGLQVHGYRHSPPEVEVRWRNIRIREFNTEDAAE